LRIRAPQEAKPREKGILHGLCHAKFSVLSKALCFAGKIQRRSGPEPDQRAEPKNRENAVARLQQPEPGIMQVTHYKRKLVKFYFSRSRIADPRKRLTNSYMKEIFADLAKGGNQK
jgi:hypothetical protein